MSGFLVEIEIFFFYIILMIKIMPFTLLFILFSCGGGGGTTPEPIPPIAQPETITFKNVPDSLSMIE